jgi:branched-chain amino acid transport system substrate-binding protein
MKPTRPSLLVGLLAVLLLPVLAFSSACGSPSASSASTTATETPSLQTAAPVSDKEPYKVGAVFAVTGFNSPLGTPERDTALMLVDQINAKGGINGHKLDLVVYDTESDETKAVTAVKKLIEEDKVLAIIGPSSTGESLALADTIQKAQVPLVSCASSIKIVQPVNPWIFKTAQSDVLAVQELYGYLKKAGTTDIAILTSGGGFGSTGKAALESEAKNYGINLVTEETFGDQDQDMTAQVTKIKESGAKAMIVWGTNPGPAIITKNAQQIGLTIPIYQSHGVSDQKFIDLAGDAANGVVFPSGKITAPGSLPDSDPQKAVILAYTKAFQEKYGHPADHFGGHAYDALMLVANALEKVGPDSAKIRDTIESTTGFVGVTGVFNMSAQDHGGLDKSAFIMVKITNGKWTLAD